MDSWVLASLRLHNECQYSSHAANYREGLYEVGGVGSEDENTGAGGSHSWVNSVGDDIMLQVIGRPNTLTHM